MTGEITKIRRAGIDSLESDKDVPESADKDTNWRPIIKLNDGDDDSHSETPETFKAKHMQEEMGGLRTKIPRWYHGHVDHRTRLLRLAGFYQRMKHAKDTMIPSTLGHSGSSLEAFAEREEAAFLSLTSEIDTILASSCVSFFSS